MDSYNRMNDLSEGYRTYRPEAPRKRSVFRRHLVLWLVLGTLVTCFGFGSGTVSAQPANLFAGRGCTMTVYATGPWPMMVNITTILVDGQPVRTSGSGIAPPFGSATIELYHTTTGIALAACRVLSYDSGPVPFPTQHRTITLASS